MPGLSRIAFATSVTLATFLSATVANAGCGDRPGTPTDVAAEALSSSSIVFKWRETTRENERPAGIPTHDIEVKDGKGALVRSFTGVGNYGGRRLFSKLDLNTKYCFRIRARTEPGNQGCVSEKWSAWACATTFSPPLTNGCKPGLVPRLASRSDRVCVTPGSHAMVVRENELAPRRRSPNGGAYGPLTCRPGYVWREAFDGDAVCVTPARRAAVKEENRHPK